jgi:hypothetical protein
MSTLQKRKIDISMRQHFSSHSNVFLDVQRRLKKAYEQNAKGRSTSALIGTFPQSQQRIFGRATRTKEIVSAKCKIKIGISRHQHFSTVTATYFWACTEDWEKCVIKVIKDLKPDS